MQNFLMIENLPKGEYQAAPLSDIRSLTSQGWKLVCLVQTQETLQVSKPPLMGPHGILTQIYEQEIATVTKALMRRDENSALGQAATRISELQAQLRIAEQLGIASETENREKTKIVSELTKDRDLLRGLVQKETAAKCREQELRDRLEMDIAKLRSAIGELRMKEILSGKTPS